MSLNVTANWGYIQTNHPNNGGCFFYLVVPVVVHWAFAMGKTENEIQNGGSVVNDRTADVIGRQLLSDVVSNLQQETILTLLISILVLGKIIGIKG